MKTFNKFILISLTFLMLYSTVFAQAETNPTIKMRTEGETGIVPTCYVEEGGGKTRDVPCESFEQLVMAVKNVINFIVKFVLMFTVVIIAYAGFLYMTSGSNPGNIAKANEMFLSVAKGLFFIGAAWLIVTLITNALLKKEFLDNSIL